MSNSQGTKPAQCRVKCKDLGGVASLVVLPGTDSLCAVDERESVVIGPMDRVEVHRLVYRLQRWLQDTKPRHGI